MTDTKLLINFAYCKETNEFVPPQQASKELTYSCLKCDNELIVKHGEIRTKHYAHKTECGCDGKICGESEEHKLSKKLLLQNKDHTTFIHTFSCGHSNKFNFTEMKEEFKIDLFRLDVGAFIGEVVKGAVEVYNTHKCEDAKREALREKDILVIELRSEQIIETYTTCNNDTTFNSCDTKKCNECVLKEIEAKRVFEEQKREEKEKHDEIIKIGKTKCFKCEMEHPLKNMVYRQGKYGCKTCFCSCGQQKNNADNLCSTCKHNLGYKKCPDCDKHIEKWKHACNQHVCKCKKCDNWTRKKTAIDFNESSDYWYHENDRWGCSDCFTDCPRCGGPCYTTSIEKWKMCYKCEKEKEKEERVNMLKEKEEKRITSLRAKEEELIILQRDGKKKCDCETIISLTEVECTKCLTKRLEKKRVHDGAFAAHKRDVLDKEKVINNSSRPFCTESYGSKLVYILNTKRKDEIKLKAEQELIKLKAEQELIRLKEEQTEKILCDNRVDELIRRGTTTIIELDRLINKRIGCKDCSYSRHCGRCIFLLGCKEKIQKNEMSKKEEETGINTVEETRLNWFNDLEVAKKTGSVINIKHVLDRCPSSVRYHRIHSKIYNDALLLL